MCHLSFCLLLSFIIMYFGNTLSLQQGYVQIVVVYLFYLRRVVNGKTNFEYYILTLRYIYIMIYRHT